MKDALDNLQDAINFAEAVNPLPRCQHGSCLRDGGGELLEPPCGCRYQTSHAETARELANDIVSRWLMEQSGFHVGLSDGNTEPDYADLVPRITSALQSVEARTWENAIDTHSALIQEVRECLLGLIKTHGEPCANLDRCSAVLKARALYARLKVQEVDQHEQ